MTKLEISNMTPPTEILLISSHPSSNGRISRKTIARTLMPDWERKSLLQWPVLEEKRSDSNGQLRAITNSPPARGGVRGGGSIFFERSREEFLLY